MSLWLTKEIGLSPMDGPTENGLLACLRRINHAKFDNKKGKKAPIILNAGTLLFRRDQEGEVFHKIAVQDMVGPYNGSGWIITGETVIGNMITVEFYPEKLGQPSLGRFLSFP